MLHVYTLLMKLMLERSSACHAAYMQNTACRPAYHSEGCVPMTFQYRSVPHADDTECRSSAVMCYCLPRCHLSSCVCGSCLHMLLSSEMPFCLHVCNLPSCVCGFLYSCIAKRSLVCEYLACSAAMGVSKTKPTEVGRMSCDVAPMLCN